MPKINTYDYSKKGEVVSVEQKVQSLNVTGELLPNTKLVNYSQECYEAWESFNSQLEVYYVKINLPEKPSDPESILNFGLPKDDRVFRYPDKKMLDSIEEVYQKDGVDIEQIEEHLTEEQTNFILQEVDRYKNGLFFYNGDKLEYITGEHYFYISYWKIPIFKNGELIPSGNPFFIDADRDHFYFWDEVVKSKTCFGILESFRRRSGKTHKANSRGYKGVTGGGRRHMGIQSKTEDDAKEVFEKLIYSWQELPYFFKPIDTGNSNPKDTLIFDQPKTLSAKTRMYRNVLRSKITLRATTEKAYDGMQLFRYIMDEAGKWEKVSVAKTWGVVREAQAVGSNILGKAIITSTVEEMTKGGGQAFKDLWEDADPLDVSPRTGRTRNGLWRYFSPADYGFIGDDNDVDENGDPVVFIDKWGYSNREAARAYILDERERKRGDDKLSWIRKYPLEEKDMWVTPSGGSPFALERIYDQRDTYNAQMMIEEPERGNFYWIEKFRSAEWKADPNGRWLNTYIPKIKNRVSFHQSSLIPLNKDLVAGCDPIDTGKEVLDIKRASKAASYVYRKFDIHNPNDSDAFVCEYINRRDTAELFYEDMAMQCIFFGNKMLVESNKIGLINWFKDNGLKEFLFSRPPETEVNWSKLKTRGQEILGLPTNSDAVRRRLIEYVQTYVYEHIGYNEQTGLYGFCPFDRLLNDWIEFNPENWTPHDSFVASALALAAADIPVYKRREVRESSVIYRYDT